MMCNRSFGFTIAVAYLLLIVVTFIGGAGGREIRPSEHRLEYQNGPQAGKKSPGMMTFFKGTSSSALEVALPKAINSSYPAMGFATKFSFQFLRVLVQIY
ncbi:hypothetical protein L1049_014782 [Liquidambar formosana]|uniref:Uncharacterized protein n=1 Tax=Liquidambar formosana TaxID=63359 RepID=A0AAP0X101_LIQFO